MSSSFSKKMQFSREQHYCCSAVRMLKELLSSHQRATKLGHISTGMHATPGGEHFCNWKKAWPDRLPTKTVRRPIPHLWLWPRFTVWPQLRNKTACPSNSACKSELVWSSCHEKHCTVLRLDLISDFSIFSRSCYPHDPFHIVSSCHRGTETLTRED